MTPKKVEFDPPEGLQMPEGKVAGDTVEFMAEFQIKENGQLCLVSIEDHDMPGYKDEDSKQDYAPTSSKFSDSYKSAMAPDSQGQGGM